MNKSLYFTVAFVLFVFAIGTGCVNKDYLIDTDEIDLEAQFAPGGVEVLLGFFEPKNLGEMLSDVEELSTDQDGYYYLSFSAATELHYNGVEIPEIDPIDLSLLTDYLGDNIESNLVPPTLTFAVENTLPTEISAEMNLTTKRKDGSEIISLTALVTLLPSEDGVTPRTTYIFIADDDVPFPEDGNTYTRVIPQGYDKLLSVIPTTIEVKLDSNMEGRPFDLELTYRVDIPLSFHKGMDLAIEMTETGLNDTFSDLADYGVKASQIAVAIEVDTSIPLQLGKVGDKAPTLDFLDMDGGNIAGLKTTIANAVTGPGDGETGVKTSRLSVTIEVPNGGDFATLRQIDQLRLSLPVDVTRTETRPNKNETIGGRLYISLPKGANIDLGAL
jgi:hypothetical protein